MSVLQRRHEAVRGLIERVAAIQDELGVTKAAVARIRDELIALAARTELFPAEEFAPVGKTGGLIRLAEEANHDFALYAVIGTPGRKSPIHNHTTWAAIAGVRGAEHNIVYERTDNRDSPGNGRLRRLGELTIEPGVGIGYLPDEFHEIEMVGDGPWLQLHLYGRSLEHLPDRIRFAGPDGGAYETYPANPTIGQLQLPPEAVKWMLADDDELALLDVREEGPFSLGHLLFASNLPLTRLERDIALLVPRRGTRVVVIDAEGEGLAQLAARRLFDLGWTNIAVLRGGVAGWAGAGYVVFSGFNVPSKAFGEVIEHACDTPHIDADELKRRLDRGEDLVILDSRPLDEFTVMSIPGGIDVPGVELVARTPALAPDPDTLVVVNCAGRTRSIIGAQLLRNAGLPNRVLALKDGTAGWHLAGYPLAHDQTRAAPPPDAAAQRQARAAAEALATRCDVPVIDRTALARLDADPDRALFRFDVRTPDEYRHGHLPGFRHAAGGQLVQATDQYVGTLRSRIVLADDDGVRARLTASWLVQLGWPEVYVLDDAFVGQALEQGEEPPPQITAPNTASISAAELHQALRTTQPAPPLVIDLRISREFRRGHVPGSHWASRQRWRDAAADASNDQAIVLVSEDGLLAHLAAAEHPDARMRVLAGGWRDWRAAGLAEEAGECFLHEPADQWIRPDDGTNTPEGRMRGYLEWEVGLPALIERDGDARFRVLR